jgi:hypothetical protein
MAMVLPNPEETALFLLQVADLLRHDTPDPTDSYDVDTRRTEDAATEMVDLGENLRAAFPFESAEALVSALMRVCREMLAVCTVLEEEYALARRPEPGPDSLLEHARMVLDELDEHVRALIAAAPNLLN